MEAEPHDPERRSLVTPGRSQRKEKSVQGRARSRRRSRSRSRSRSRRRSRSCRRDCSRNISHSRHGSRRRSCNRGRSPSINFENSHNSARSQSRYCDLYIKERHLYNERKRIRELEDELQKKLRDLDSDKIQPLQNKSNKRQHEESVPQTPLEVSPKHTKEQTDMSYNVSIKTTPNDKYKVMIKINGNSICCQVDLGSEVTLIRESDAKAIKLTWTSVNSPYLRGLGNIPYLPLGRTFADIELQGLVEKQVEILIVADSLINLPVLLGHSFTERPNLRIIKTDTYLQFDRVDDTLNSKISLRSGVNLKIGLGEMRVLIVKSDEVYNGYVYIRGNIRGCPGNEHYLLPGEYEIVNVNYDLSVHTYNTTIKYGEQLTDVEVRSLKELLHRYKTCFSTGMHDLGFTTVTEMEIHLKDVNPVVYRPYRLSHSERQLPEVQLGINTSVHDVTKRTPTEMLFGRKVNNPSQGILNSISDDIGNGVIKDSLDKIRLEAKELIKYNQEKNKDRFDLKRKSASKYKEGDLVKIIRTIAGNSGQSKKLEPKCQGPYRIKKILPNDRFVVEDTPLTRKGKRYENVVSIDKISPWLSFSAPVVSSDSSDNDSN
ncbi:unnamed protein product, partial [Brenthis ino]